VNPEIVGAFRKSSFSGNQPDCVETAPTADGGRAVRDSKSPEAGTHFYSATEWSAFIQSVKDGRYDL